MQDRSAIIAHMAGRTQIVLNAHLLSGEASYRSAGIHSYLFNTLAHLPDIDSELCYTVFVGAGNLPERAEWEVRRTRLPTRKPLMRVIWEQLIAPLELARLKPALLHGMGFALPLAWPGRAVVTVFDLSFFRHPERLGALRRVYLNAITRESVRRASWVIAISEHGKSEINKVFGKPLAQIDVALPGVAAHFARRPAREVADFRRRQGLPARFILYMGTIEPRKNLRTVIRAFDRVRRKHPVKLVLAGGMGWQYEEVLAEIAKPGLQQEVLFPGYIRSEAQALWYSSAELFVYPSVYEGFGMPPLEAMACGLPVIASDSASLPEVVGGDGLLCSPEDGEQWADAMEQLLVNQTLRTELSARGQARARQFTWEQTARQTVRAYRLALEHVGSS